MALATTLYEWLGSADARFETLCSPENAQSTLSLLDAFFQQATGLQLQREQLKALSREAQTALNEDTRLVFLLYMRVLALLKKQIQQQQQQAQSQDEVLFLDTKLVDSVLHVTRIVPFCQLYARNNAKSVEQLLTELVVHVEGFEASVGKLHDVYLKHLQKLHVSAQQDKRNQVLDLIQSMHEISLSLDGLLTSDSMVTPLLLSGGKDPELVFQGETLMRALVVCYESDLPTLQRHLVKLDDKAQDKTLIIAETRRLLLQVLGRFMNRLMKKQDDGNHDEVLLEVLHMISHCCEEENADQGSYLSDLWYLCGYKDKISTFLESGEIESDHVSYLEMIVDGLPRRRIISAGMSSAKTPAVAQESSRPAGSETDARGGHAAASAGGFGQHDDEEEKDDPYAVAAGGEDAAMLSSMVHQVKDFFPDLGGGYIELCLISSQKQLETVINFLLESNPPPALLEVRQDLKRSDPEFAVTEAKLTGKTPAVAAAAKSAAKPKSEEKLDPSRVWVGKKPQEKHYDPQILKRDTALAEKTKKIANMIVEEEEIMAGMTPFLKLDEYDDDYNDEFEDYEPFSVHDSGQTDQDTIRQQNRLMLAREAEDAFWESMKNVNHQQPVAHGEEIDEDKESKETYEFNPNKIRAPAVRGSSAIAAGQQKQGPPQGKPPTDQKKKNGQQNWKKAAPAPGAAPDAAGATATAAAAGATPEKTKEQELRARARSAKNKAKVGNHHRKDRALKKQG